MDALEKEQENEVQLDSVEELESTEPEVSQDEQRATGNGWTNRETWEGKGNNPDDWVSARKFNERGEMIGEIRSLKRRLDDQETGFSTRLDSQKKIHQAQIKVTIADLESKRDDAIDLADKDRANTIQAQIDDVRTQSAELDVEHASPATDDQSVLDAWNADNAWVAETDSPKAAYAIMRFNNHLGGGKTTAEAIAAMENEVAKQFPDKNLRRESAPNVEGGRSKPGQRAAVKLSWGQLTNDEVKWYNAMPTAWKSKDDYLQAVADDRKGA